MEQKIKDKVSKELKKNMDRHAKTHNIVGLLFLSFCLISAFLYSIFANLESTHYYNSIEFYLTFTISYMATHCIFHLLFFFKKYFPNKS